MADTKITALAAIATVDPAADVLPIVDISDTSMAASGTTKKVTSNQILGAGGTATLASATITGALTVDTTTLVANAAGYADRVGIGTATPGAALEVSGSATNVFIRSTDTNDSALRYYVNGTEVAVCRGKNGNSYAIETAGAESFRINSTGNIVLKGGTTTANGVGVTFPATQVDSSDANCLDDYEEGTWTPAYSPTTGAFTTLPTVGSGKYRKIGDTVFFSIAIRTAGTVVLGAASGDIQITGFPFTCSAAGGNGTSSLFQQFNLAVSSAHLGISITGSTTIATITKNLSNGSVTYVQANELSTATGNFENLIYAFGMYNV